jgi:hypothetical protein
MAWPGTKRRPKAPWHGFGQFILTCECRTCMSYSDPIGRSTGPAMKKGFVRPVSPNDHPPPRRRWGRKRRRRECRRSDPSCMPLRSFHPTRNGGTKVDHRPVEFAVHHHRRMSSGLSCSTAAQASAEAAERKGAAKDRPLKVTEGRNRPPSHMEVRQP